MSAAGDPRCPSALPSAPAAGRRFPLSSPGGWGGGEGKSSLALRRPPARGLGELCLARGTARGARWWAAVGPGHRSLAAGGAEGRRPRAPAVGRRRPLGRRPLPARGEAGRGKGAPGLRCTPCSPLRPAPPVGGRQWPGGGRRRRPGAGRPRWRPARPPLLHLTCPPALLWRLRRARQLSGAERPEPPAASPRLVPL